MKVYEVWQTRAFTRPEMCSQECQVQRMPQDWTLLQGMLV